MTSLADLDDPNSLRNSSYTVTCSLDANGLVSPSTTYGDMEYALHIVSVNLASPACRSIVITPPRVPTKPPKEPDSPELARFLAHPEPDISPEHLFPEVESIHPL